MLPQSSNGHLLLTGAWFYYQKFLLTLGCMMKCYPNLLMAAHIWPMLGFILTLGCTYDVFSQSPDGNSHLTSIFDSEWILFCLNTYPGLGQLLSASLAAYILDVILSFHQYLTLKLLYLPLGFRTELSCDSQHAIFHIRFFTQSALAISTWELHLYHRQSKSRHVSWVLGCLHQSWLGGCQSASLSRSPPSSSPRDEAWFCRLRGWFGWPSCKGFHKMATGRACGIMGWRNISQQDEG
jgi:hypothetical protein